MTAKCIHCGEDLVFGKPPGHPRARKAWRHVKDGGEIVQRCDECGWEGAPYPARLLCPVCRGKYLRDNHVACPISSTKEP